ncbi:RNA exonuclease 3 [Bachmanniomyces sp. S44760]|nr:RNA exonuclease 3 [Bachmanniomyces sp. S44760]
MFSSLGLFQNTTCPEDAKCSLPNCFFSHDASVLAHSLSASNITSTVAHDDSKQDLDNAHNADHPRKKRRVCVEDDEQSHDMDTTPAPVATEVDASTSPHRIEEKSNKEAKKPPNVPLSTVKEVSPPPLRVHQVRPGLNRNLASKPTEFIKPTKSIENAKPQARTIKNEELNPRRLNKPPATHMLRLKLLTMLHEHMVRLNEEMKDRGDDSSFALVLSSSELIKVALDEEEATAIENPSVYSNMLKLRIVALKKMNPQAWRSERLKQFAKEDPKAVAQEVKPPKELQTGLTSSAEIFLLPKLVAKQDNLSKHGYVTNMPTTSEIESAGKGVAAAQGWEECDRCKTRFQAFPGRRSEDGALTTGGRCTYHFGKARKFSRGSESVYSCCNLPLGTLGCHIGETHVFKVSESKRLAMILPFEATPKRRLELSHRAVCFDCEMAYTTYGMELIRLTATAWPDGRGLLDVLVRPNGEILDLNSRFSGVWPKHYQNAQPYSAEQNTGIVEDGTLQLVDSPAKARGLLFGLLNANTPLIGHAIENDLNAARIIHPTIVDSVLLYPHPRGLPMRYGLKMLVKKYLDRDIQMSGAEGHDSNEDARAAGDLVRLKVSELWKAMMREGWTVEHDVFCPPPT